MKRLLLLSFLFLASFFSYQLQAQTLESPIIVDTFPFTYENLSTSDGETAIGMIGNCPSLVCCSVKVFKVILPGPGYLRGDIDPFTPLANSIIAYSSNVENPSSYADLTFEAHPGNFCGFRDSLALGRDPEVYGPSGSDDITYQFGPVGPGTYHNTSAYYVLVFLENNQVGFNLGGTADITFDFTPRCPGDATCSTASYTDCNGTPYNSPAGNIYTESGAYTDTLVNTIGGDSLIYLTVDISAPDLTETVQTAMADISSCSNQTANVAARSHHVSYGEFNNADGDWVEINEVAPEIAGTNRSVSAWIKHPNQVSGSSQMIVGMNTSGTGTVSNFLIGTNEKIGVYDGGSFRYGTSIITDGEWHHVAYTYDEATNGTIIYVDGVVEKTYTNGQTIATNGRVSIGQEYDGSSTGNYFDGFISEVSIWNEVLSESDIQVTMNSAITSNHPKYANLKAYYPMNPYRDVCTTDLTDVRDISGNNLHGVASNDILSTTNFEEISGFNSASYFDKTWTYNGNILSSSDTLQLNTPYSGSYELSLSRQFLKLTDTWSISASSNCVDYDWGQIVEGDADLIPYGIKSDDAGNVFTVGSFEGTADFDSGVGTSNLTSAGGTDIFIMKTNINGDFVWAKRMGSTENDSAYDVTFDSNNNIYVSGYFSNTVDFNPGSGTSNITSIGDEDVFIVKLDLNGEFVWAKSMGGASDEKATHMEFDNEDNLIVAGEFGSVAFQVDPGSGNPNLARPSTFSFFVVKFDTNGSYIWAKAVGSAGVAFMRGLAIDNNNNIIFTGTYGGTIDLDPSTGEDIYSLVGTSDTFVEKLNSNGDYQWGKTISNAAVLTNSSGVVTDNAGNVYTIGVFNGTTDFDPSANTAELASNGYRDVFLQKLDSSGNYIWVKSFGDLYSDYAHDIDTDGDNIYTLYDFRFSVDIDPSAATNTLTTTNDDFVISKFDSDGNLIWGHQIHNNHAGTYLASMDVNKWGNITTAGRLWANTTTDFDYLGDGDAHTSSSNTAGFIMQLNDAPTFQNHTYYATNSGAGLQNGYSADNAAPSLSSLMGVIKGGDTVYVMDGLLNETTDLLIPSNTTLYITDGATVNTGTKKLSNYGQINIGSNAALVQGTGSAIDGSGSFKIERSAGNNTALFNFLASPINNINVQQVFAGSNCVAFDPADQSNGLNGWTYVLTDNLVNGHGYAVNGANTADFNGIRAFNGKANNGDISVNLNGQTYGGGYDGWNLLGNPYPSALDMKNYIDNNSDVGAVTIYDQSAEMYVTYNTLNADGLQIASGQGFFVEFSTANSGTANFKNSMRYESAGTIEKNASVAKAVLHITDEFGDAYDTYIGFMETASDGFDPSYDARLIPGANELNIFSLLDDEAMAIQTIEATQESRIIPIGIESLGGELSISLGQLELFSSDTDILLIDHEFNKKHNLRKGAYSFIADEGLFESRFELQFKRQRQTMYDFSDITPKLSLQNQQIVIENIKNIAIESVRMFDLTGKLVAQWNNIPSSSQAAYLEIQEQPNAVYLIEIVSGKKVYHEKINVQ